MEFTSNFLNEAKSICDNLDKSKIEEMVNRIAKLKDKKGRLFVLGVGGSAANSSHAVNDFRKLTNIESYAPTDNVSELTARTNDEGWDSVFVNYLKCSNLDKDDAILIFSVGGGDLEKNVSINLCKALDYAKSLQAQTLSITGRDQGYSAKNADCNLTVPVRNSKNLTPLTEAFQGIIWHLLVSHPLLKMNETKW